MSRSGTIQGQRTMCACRPPAPNTFGVKRLKFERSYPTIPAMEHRLSISSASVSPITALTYQSMRREIVTGHEDGALKCWEVDSGRLAVTLLQHKGWVTDLLYWHEGRVLFSASVDGTVVQWSSAGIAYNIIEVDGPVFSLLWTPRKEQLLCGRDNGISILNSSGKFASNGLPLLGRKGIHVPGHRDIVKCLSCTGNKVFSAGYDRKLMIYEVSSMPGERDVPLKCIHMNPAAHDAGITCLLVAKDADSSTWIATGSFDKKVKIWTADGKLIHSIQCTDGVSGVCYVPQMRVLWISAGTSMPNFYEPKSGENISDCMPVFGSIKHITGNSVVQLLKYFPEINEVIGTTNRKAVLSWRYNPSCCVCVQDAPSASHIETLTYTSKVPILLFTGSYDGEVTKWERLQLNPFMYSQEPLPYREQLGIHLESEEGEKNMLEILQCLPGGEGGGPQTEGKGKPKNGMSEELKERTRKRLMKPKFRGFLKSLFVESLDFLVASSLDGKIFVWGYDKKTVAVLMQMQRQPHNHKNAAHNQQKLNNGHAPEANPDTECSTEQPQTQGKLTEGSVISRVAGFTCLYILNGHSASVTGLAVVERDKAAGVHTTCLLSAGWDLTICVWDLEKGRLMAQLSVSPPPSSADPSNSDSDDIITDLSYSKERNVFAYSSSDKLVYLRRFSENQAEMEVVGTLAGHSKEVTQVSWNSFSGRWATGSEDGTIRIWAADGGACEQMVSTGGPVSFLCIDKTNGVVIAAVQQVIKVYDSNLELLRVSHGHTDSIRTIIHVPELDQYISAGWDHTLRVWNTCHPKGIKRATN